MGGRNEERGEIQGMKGNNGDGKMGGRNGGMEGRKGGEGKKEEMKGKYGRKE